LDTIINSVVGNQVYLSAKGKFSCGLRRSGVAKQTSAAVDHSETVSLEATLSGTRGKPGVSKEYSTINEDKVKSGTLRVQKEKVRAKGKGFCTLIHSGVDNSVSGRLVDIM